jgi:hypothetical protein
MFVSRRRYVLEPLHITSLSSWRPARTGNEHGGKPPETRQYGLMNGKAPSCSSPLNGEHDAEPHPAAVHVLVGFRHAMEWIGFDHRVHPGQGTEFQGVL